MMVRHRGIVPGPLLSLTLGFAACVASTAFAQDAALGGSSTTARETATVAGTVESPTELKSSLAVLKWVDPERLASSAQLIGSMLLLGLVPAVLLMTTSYVRIAVVLAILRQAFGTQQLLPAQVTAALAMFCTAIVMWPTWQTVHDETLQPLLNGESGVDVVATFETGSRPLREFMTTQIAKYDNQEDVHLFLRAMSSPGDAYPASWGEVPMRALLPAFLLSELKTAFLIGFRVLLPFLVVDLVVATFATSLGMFMLPPAMISLPLKLLLFVSVDGWRLVVDMLFASFQ